MEECVFPRAAKERPRHWLGLAHWWQLRQCCELGPWLELGLSLSHRRLFQWRRRVNFDSTVTSACFLCLGLIAAAALP